MAITLTQDEKKEVIKYLDKYRKKITKEDEEEIKMKTIKKVNRLKRRRKNKQFESKMFEQIEKLLLLMDSNSVDKKQKKTIITSFYYFCEVEDKIPDYQPLGLIDDAFVVDIIYSNFRGKIYKIKKK